jgi:hypothetical protein
MSRPQELVQMEPKLRIVKVDVHVLAYLGDYMKVFKALVKKRANTQ